MTTRSTRILSLLAALLTTGAQAQQTGLTAETWNNLTKGTSVLILQKEGISNRAADVTAITGAQVTGALAAGKGMRLRGSITPVESDTYTFWISGADNVALWISDDSTRFNKKLVAYNLGSTNVAEWDKHSNQRSIPLTLTGGQSYYLEAQVMDFDGGGHISVAWRGQKGRYALASNGSTATQSSTKWGAEASRAIDGNTSGVWGNGEVTLTNSVANSWLQVTFPQNRSVNQVVLYNNSQNQNQLSNFRLSVLDENDAELSGQNFFTTSGNVGNSMIWNLPATVPNARKVKIQLLGYNLAGNGTLSIAEIEAYGIGLVQGQVDFREVIPSSYLSPLQTDAADTNNNNLPDTWETQTGLAASSLAGAQLEYGDPDNDGLSNYQEQWLGSNPLVKEAVADGLTRFIWMGINGSSISNLTTAKSFYSYPNLVDHVPGVDETINRTLFGARYRGAIVAPVTGAYRFWISGSAGAELWFSDGSIQPPGASQPLTNRFGKRRIGTSGYVTPLHDFDYSPSQRSGWIHLVQGEKYYIEVLHSQQNGTDHVSLAWKVPGQTREIIPASAFQSDIPEDTDGDRDNLPDAWETSVTLSTTDNGFINLKEGEFGDFDSDKLTNLQEYQHGTNPKSTDSDGDGISDGDEVNLYGSNPLASNNLAPITLALPPLHQYTAATGGWTLNNNGSISAQERRGDVTYTFTVTEPGVHEVAVAAGAISATAWYTYSLPLTLTLNGDNEPFGSKVLRSQYGNADTIRAITPWLSAGTHTVTIHHENYSAALRLRIDSVSIKRLGGADLDEDGIPDWIEDNAMVENALTRVPTESRTSPVSIEGITTQLSSTALTVGGASGSPIPTTASINNSFFADVPLSATGAVTLDASFQNGVVTQSQAITWSPTNLLEAFTNDTLHIRAGDALRVTAHDPVEGASGSFILGGSTLLSLPSGSQQSDSPVVVSFATPGTHTLTAIWTPESGPTQTAEVTIEVHAANFGPSHIVLAYKARTWTPTSLDSTSQIEADERLIFTETTVNPQTGPRTFLVKAEEPVNRYVIARLPADTDGAPSAILARGTVHAFDLADVSDTGDAQVVTQYPDGTWLMSTTFVAVNLPLDILIRITSNNQGTLFTNGSNILEIRAGDFDANGIATVFFEWSGTGALPKLCFSTGIFIDP